MDESILAGKLASFQSDLANVKDIVLEIKLILKNDYVTKTEFNLELKPLKIAYYGTLSLVGMTLGLAFLKLILKW